MFFCSFFLKKNNMTIHQSRTFNRQVIGDNFILLFFFSLNFKCLIFFFKKIHWTRLSSEFVSPNFYLTIETVSKIQMLPEEGDKLFREICSKYKTLLNLSFQMNQVKTFLYFTLMPVKLTVCQSFEEEKNIRKLF